jgi:hypothetical protein
VHASANFFVGALASSDLFTHCCKSMENVWEAIQQDGHKNVGMLSCIKYKRQWEIF